VQVLPVSAALVISLASYRFSLMHNTVSVAQVVKGLQPLCSLMVSRSLLRERSSVARTCSLVLLVSGVAFASATEVNFNSTGFALAMLSSLTQSMQSVQSKALLVHGTLSRTELFAVSAVFALLLLLPVWAVIDAIPLLSGSSGDLSVRVLLLLLANGACNFVSQLMSFTVLCLLISPVSAAVVSTIKRVLVIAIAAVWFGTPVTLLHACGIATTAMGVGWYQATTQREIKRKQEDEVLLAPGENIV